ncbi:hypothetical protein MPSEU_001105000 [Mayamaea pseudoterrestris]|nr:hypothetical protein MPSEU_001105000 [Mayamaea pseudoterrestris]
MFLSLRTSTTAVLRRSCYKSSLQNRAVNATSWYYIRGSKYLSTATTTTNNLKNPLLEDDVEQPLLSPLFVWGKSSLLPKTSRGSNEVVNVPVNVDYSQAFNMTTMENSSNDIDHVDSIAKLVCGATDTAWITTSGRCFVMGLNKNGQLGLGHKRAVEQPQELVIQNKNDTGSDTNNAPPLKISNVSLGANSSALIDSHGNLYTSGFGGSVLRGMGQLGLGSAQSYQEFQLVTSLMEDGVYAKQAVVGESHLTVLTTEGEVLSCGAGSYGRLGNFETTDQLYLEPVELLTVNSNITSIACGKSFTLALTRDGVLYGWGRNHKGQLGTGLGLAVDMYAMQSVPEPIEADELVGRKVIQVSAGQNHAACITEGGELFVWGMQLYLEPVRVNELLHTQIVKVSCGNDYTLAVDKDGYMYSFGKGKNGCLAQGSVKQANQAALVEALQHLRVTQVSAGWDHAACLVEERK